MWEERNGEDVWARPAWELCLSDYWDESVEEWHARWVQCGGQLREGRMVAAKWDGIWERLSATFYDGLGKPYPPYARSSAALWMDVDQDEAVVMGAVTESELDERLANVPVEPLLDHDGNQIPSELLEAALQELRDDSFSREERVEHRREEERKAMEQVQADYAAKNQQRDEKDAVFRLLELVEQSLRETPAIHDDRRWEWLCDSLKKLTATEHFEPYPNWRARAWLASANMYRSTNSPADELACLRAAIELNPKLPIKRRIKALETTAGN